jgi:hypothetical protein
VLSLLLVNDLHIAPSSSLGGAERFQHHPAVAALKCRLDGAFLADLEARDAEVDVGPPGRPAGAMRALGVLGLVPDVYRWLADAATPEEVVTFLAYEGGPDGGFDDLVAACQIGLSGSAKLELAQNYWDEMGNGQLDLVHTELHHKLAGALGLPALSPADQPLEALERAALASVLATNRRLQPEMVGALGLLELQAGPRCRKVVTALRRIGASDDALHFYLEHATVDPRHGKDWVDKAVVPLGADPGGRRASPAVGAGARSSTPRSSTPWADASSRRQPPGLLSGPRPAADVPTTTFGPVRVTYATTSSSPARGRSPRPSGRPSSPPGPCWSSGAGPATSAWRRRRSPGRPSCRSTAARRPAAGRANAAAAGLHGRVEQRCGELHEVLDDGERFAVVIADPPYVESSDVRRFPEDPEDAIDGGEDGLDLVRTFLATAARHLAPGGSIVLQLGAPDQIDAVASWLRGPGAPALAVVDRRVVADDRALALLTAAPRRRARPAVADRCYRPRPGCSGQLGGIGDLHPEELRRLADPLAGGCGGVDGGQGGRRVEVVVEGGTDLVEGARTAPCRPPGVEPGRSRRHEVVEPLPAVAVVVREDGEADRSRVPLLAEVADEHEVPERLRHLHAVERHHRRVQPVAHEALPGGRLRLRRLALVVGEDQVAATAVEVHGGPELPQRQGRALDVPPGAARSPQRLPRRLALGRGLPQHEVERVPLVGVVDLAAALGRERQHLLLVVAADLPEPGNVEMSKYTDPPAW